MSIFNTDGYQEAVCEESYLDSARRFRRPTKRIAHLAAAAVMTAWLVLVVIPA